MSSNECVNENFDTRPKIISIAGVITEKCGYSEHEDRKNRESMNYVEDERLGNQTRSEKLLELVLELGKLEC